MSDSLIKTISNSSVYAAYGSHRDQSTSGGISYELSKFVLAQGGVVCGAILTSDMSAKHVCAETEDEIQCMRDSKYIPSSASGIYSAVYSALSNRRTVLFTGTPCQNYALKKYLEVRKMKMDGLILCDLVCHGVGSPKVFHDYIALCEKRSGKKIVGHKFRDKSIGWHQPRDCNYFEDGSKDYLSHWTNLYTNIYVDNVCQRESCTFCPYASTDRCSDITIGDFWGIEKIAPDFDDNKGISLVMCNTEKGKQIMQQILPNIVSVERTLEEAIMKQPHLTRPLQYGKKYDQFWGIYAVEGFEGVVRKMYQYGWKYDMLRAVKNVLRPMKKVVKLLLHKPLRSGG